MYICIHDTWRVEVRGMVVVTQGIAHDILVTQTCIFCLFLSLWHMAATGAGNGAGHRCSTHDLVVTCAYIYDICIYHQINIYLYIYIMCMRYMYITCI